MKKLYSLFLILLFSSVLNAQWIVESFDHAVNPNTSATLNWADTAIVNTNFYTDGPTAYMDLSNSADAYQGTGSMDVKYRVEAYDGWGGYNVRTNYHEVEDIATQPFIDLSAGTELSLWYKIVTPADTSQAGTVISEFKLMQLGDDGQRSYFFYQPNFDFFDNSGQWINVIMPLKQTDDKTVGFAYQGGESADQVLHLDKIKGMEFSVVYGTAGGSTNTPVVTGEFLWDDLQLLGNHYTPIFTFDNSASEWAIDNMSWASQPATLNLTDESTDKVEGDGALRVDYTLTTADTVWGGFAAFEQPVTAPDSFSNRTALVFYIKNLIPNEADSGKTFIRVFLSENSTGSAGEDWIIDVGVDLSQPFDWTRCYLPLIEKPMGANDRFPPKDGFALKNGVGDNKINPEAITRIRFEPFIRGISDGFGRVTTATGAFLVDVMQQSGFQFADFTAPEAPADLNVIQGTYTNLITWTDVPGETAEKYSVYYSKNPITDVTAADVSVVALSVAEDVQAVEHVILSPVTDAQETYYYAVLCTDRAGNVGPISSSGAVQNMAQGVTTVHWGKPANFMADGDFSEWDGIQPFRMFPSDGSGTVVTNTFIDDDADLSVNAYVAMDQDSLYVAFDVTDNTVSTDVSGNSWENDSPDLFIGLYPYKGKDHVGYKRGATPDYHLRFNKEMLRGDNPGVDSLLMPGANYYWEEKFPSGYAVEAKISWEDLAHKGRPASTDVVFNPVAGMSIPIDFEINDADGAIREGQLDYSKAAEGQSYASVARWTYTFIGDNTVGVNDELANVNKFQLGQNYPNPFNPTTKINYSIAKPGVVTIKVFDVLGRQVANLINHYQVAGTHSVNFNASSLSSGVYIYRIESGSFSATKKMMLIK